MRRAALALALCIFADLAVADTLVATRTIRSRTILTAQDVTVQKNDQPSALGRIEDVLGMEAKAVLYEGRPITLADIGPAAIIERNQVVTLIFMRGGLSIATEARALGRAGIGEPVRVMNLASRNTVNGVVGNDGAVYVGSAGQSPNM